MSHQISYREIEIKKSELEFKPDKELMKQLRELKIGKGFINAMKKEVVDCPMVGGQSPALKCLSCPHFVRRVKGVVHCHFGL